MTDQCKHCTIKGDYEDCLDTSCSQHESWFGIETQKQIAALKAENEEQELHIVTLIHEKTDLEIEIAALKAENEKLKQQKAYAEAKLQQVQHARDNDWGL